MSVGSESGRPRGGSVTTIRAFESCEVIRAGPAIAAMPQVGEPLVPPLQALLSRAAVTMNHNRPERTIAGKSNANGAKRLSLLRFGRARGFPARDCRRN